MIMRWIKSLGLLSAATIVGLIIFLWYRDLDYRVLNYVILSLIILSIEVFGLQKSHGIVTAFCYFPATKFFCDYINIELVPGSLVSLALFVLVPISFLIVIVKFSTVRPSLFAFLVVSVLFSVHGDIFWSIFREDVGGSVINHIAEDESHIYCGQPAMKNLGYYREANCRHHKLVYTLEGKVLSRFRLNTNFRGDRVVPDSLDSSREYAFFIGGSRTFGDGVRDEETYPNYLSELLDLNSRIWSNSGWGLNQAAFLINDRLNEIQEAGKNGNVTVYYHAIISHISRTSGSYYETMGYHPNYPKYVVRNDRLEYVGTLRTYSFFKVIVYSWIWNFCRLDCKQLFKVGASVSDYLSHLDFIYSKLKTVPNSKFVIIIHPGAYGAELKRAVDLKLHFASTPNVVIVDASELFDLNQPYVIHEDLDNHLSATGNKILAQFIASELR